MSALWFSNRYEVLAERLVQALGGARASIFDTEQVIVPSAALQRDLSLRVAERHGVCAQIEFSFLAQWLWRQIARHVPAVGADSPFAPPVLAWRIDRLLADPGLAAAHPRLAAYLDAADAVMRFGFAGRLAGLFDHYITYRSDWLATWAEGRSVALAGGRATALWRADEAWQAALWRRLLAELAMDGAHPATQFLQALEAGGAGATDAADGMPPLAASVHVFCLPAIPPLYLQVLQRLSRHTDLQLYVLNPCREYWFDLVDPRRLSHLAARGKAQHVEVGNPLLAGWGQQTQAQIDLLLDSGDTSALPDESDFVEAPGHHLLAQWQNTVLDGTALPLGSVVMGADDRSIEVHVCHSLTRELEVLHDHLLGLFVRATDLKAGGQAREQFGDPAGDQAEPLQPQHILVVTPDLDAAAPLIDAVFGTAPPDRHIPFTVTGRPRRTVNRCARALRDLLALLGSRFPASAVFELLQQAPVSRRFGLDEAALLQVHGWMAEAGIRWGLGSDTGSGSPSATGDDAALRDALAAQRHSLADGLQRLFLAHVLPGSVDEPFLGELPAGTVEGSEALALGAFWRFSENLRAWQGQWTQPHTPQRWLALLLGMLDALLLPLGDEEDELRELQASLRKLAAQMADGGLGEPRMADGMHRPTARGAEATPGSRALADQATGAAAEVEPAVLRAALDALLDEPPRGGVPTGRVTFAAMSSLRSLPFRVVCAIGLNDGAFPSVSRALEFDLMASQPQRGDRQRRHDERNTFLDLLLAARDSVYLSHTGRSVRDNAPLPPSVLVSELLDVVVPAIAEAPQNSRSLAVARARLVVEHPLQAFSPRAFSDDGDPRLRSFQREYAEALQSSRAAEAARRAGVDTTAAGASAALHPIASTGPTDPAVDDADDEADGAASRPALAFFDGPLPAPSTEWQAPDIDTLVRFFQQPCRALLQQRLGLTLPRAEENLADDEAFVPDFASRDALISRALPAALAGATPAQLEALAAAGTDQPDGAIGAAWRAEELTRLQRFAAGLGEALAVPTLPPMQADWTFDIDGEVWRLAAAFGQLRPTGLVHHRYDDARVRDHLQAWLWHLALCAAAPPGVAPVSHLHARNGIFRFEPCSEPLVHLQQLLLLYRQGLSAPLHFFPKSAWAYMDKAGGPAAMTAARSTWQVTTRHPHGESGDPAYRLALRGTADPLDRTFEACAAAVLGPLKQHLVEATVPVSEGGP